MKSLFLTIVLLGLLSALQAQDLLTFPSEELDVRLGGPVGGWEKCPEPWSAGSSCEPCFRGHLRPADPALLPLRVRDGLPSAGPRQGPSWGQGWRRAEVQVRVLWK